MNHHALPHPAHASLTTMPTAPASTAEMLERLDALLPGVEERAARLDGEGGQPREEGAALSAARLMVAPLPREQGRRGWGWRRCWAQGVGWVGVPNPGAPSR